MDNDVIHLNALVVETISFVIVLLLGVISFFMSRLVKQIDKLNETMLKMDKDIAKEIACITAQGELNRQKLQDLDPLFDRVRVLESNVAVIQSGCARGCGQ